MTITIPPSVLALTLMACMAPARAAPGIDGYRWSKRVLVVFAPEPGDPSLQEQRRILADTRAGRAEREVVVVEAVGREIGGERLRDGFGVPPQAFRAVLVGKDGGAKLNEAAPIPADRLFAAIDAMPMRRQEMREGRTDR